MIVELLKLIEKQRDSLLQMPLDDNEPKFYREDRVKTYNDIIGMLENEINKQKVITLLELIKNSNRIQFRGNYVKYEYPSKNFEEAVKYIEEGILNDIHRS